MSHYTIYKTQVGNVTVDLLKTAITSLAKRIGAEVVTSVSGRQVDIGIRNIGCPSGIGFIVQNGVLSIAGDSYNEEFKRLSILGQNYVKAFKVATASKAKGVQSQVFGKQVILELTF